MASQDPWPIMPPKSTDLRMLHFDDYAYTGTSDTVLYRYVDALAGTTGAGALVNEIFLARLGGGLQTIYFNELDFIFGKISFLSRSSAESYTYDPSVDTLTSAQWDEVRVKDAWYRARITDFFVACSKGGTPDGIREAVNAAVATDCDVYEVWRYLDNFGIVADLGRSPHTARNEFVVRPHKSELLPEELRLLRDMIGKITPLDTIVTVNTVGLAVFSPVPVQAAAADSTYFEVQKMVTATPVLAQLPPPDLLPIDLLPTQTWLYDALVTPTLAPTPAFTVSQEYGYYYLTGGGKRSPIDSVTYGTLQTDGTIKTEPNFSVYNTTGQYGPKTAYAKADSPDNYPGGKFGIHPATEPALNPDGTPYLFTWASQALFVASEIERINFIGGQADADGYRLPIAPPGNASHVFYPENAISYFPPSKDSDVSASLTSRRTTKLGGRELRDPSNFTRTH